jgi:hypothetical protein
MALEVYRPSSIPFCNSSMEISFSSNVNRELVSEFLSETSDPVLLQESRRIEGNTKVANEVRVIKFLRFIDEVYKLKIIKGIN